MNAAGEQWKLVSSGLDLARFPKPIFFLRTEKLQSAGGGGPSGYNPWIHVLLDLPLEMAIESVQFETSSKALQLQIKERPLPKLELAIQFEAPAQSVGVLQTVRKDGTVQRCNATIMGPTTLLTAQHCVPTPKVCDRTIFISPLGERRVCSRLVIASEKDDQAVLELKEPVRSFRAEIDLKNRIHTKGSAVRIISNFSRFEVVGDFLEDQTPPFVIDRDRRESSIQACEIQGSHRAVLLNEEALSATQAKQNEKIALREGHLYRTSCTIVAGQSGSPLISEEGLVTGVVFAGRQQALARTLAPEIREALEVSNSR